MAYSNNRGGYGGGGYDDFQNQKLGKPSRRNFV